MQKSIQSVAEYISQFPAGTQKRLKQLRATIRKAAPKAEESISYGMPAYKLHGALVYFAGHQNHIGFYPVPSGIKAFEKELAPYKASKATAQFPHHQPIPFDLVAKIVQYRVKENLAKAAEKKGSASSFLSQLSAPARRALEGKGLTSLQKLATQCEADLLQLHGLGPSSLPKLKQALEAAGLSFKR